MNQTIPLSKDLIGLEANLLHSQLLENPDLKDNSEFRHCYEHSLHRYRTKHKEFRLSEREDEE